MKTFTDQELKNAADAVARSMEQAFDAMPEVDYTYSESYKAEMQALLRRTRRRNTLITFARSAAAVFAVLLLSLGTWLTADADARAAFTGWVREVYEHSVIYRFSGEGKALERLPVYEVTWLPEGMKEVVHGVNRAGRYSIYNDRDMHGVYFFYTESSDGTVLELAGIDTSSGEAVEAEGLRATYYPGLEEWQSNSLVWTDDALGILFLLNGNLGREDMLAIATQIIRAK